MIEQVGSIWTGTQVKVSDHNIGFEFGKRSNGFGHGIHSEHSHAKAFKQFRNRVRRELVIFNKEDLELELGLGLCVHIPIVLHIEACARPAIYLRFMSARPVNGLHSKTRFGIFAAVSALTTLVKSVDS
jgi:hypothetical protein